MLFCSAAQTRETGVLNAYFAAAAHWAIAEDCHNQRIPLCACSVVDGVRRVTPNGDIIFEDCKADFEFAANYFQQFVVNEIDNSTVQGKVDSHNINFGREVSRRGLWVVMV